MFRSIRTRFINIKKREQIAPMLQLEEAADRGLLDADADCTGSIPGVADGLLDLALASLRPVEREVLFLAVVEGYTAREIGKLTGQSRGSVISLLYRAREKARESLRN